MELVKRMRSWIRQWLSLGSHWQNLKVLFNPTVTRLFISWFAITPIIVKAFEDVPEEVLLPTKPPIELQLDLPFNWVLLWFASLAYAIAFLIYTFACPRFLKQYRDHESYRVKGHSPRWLVWEFYYAWLTISKSEKAKLLERLEEKAFASESDEEETEKPEVSGDETRFVFVHLDKKYKVSANENLKPNQETEYFWEIFGRWAASKPIARNVAWFLFSVSISIAGFVTLQNICFVISRIGQG